MGETFVFAPAPLFAPGTDVAGVMVVLVPLGVVVVPVPGLTKVPVPDVPVVPVLFTPVPVLVVPVVELVGGVITVEFGVVMITLPDGAVVVAGVD